MMICVVIAVVGIIILIPIITTGCPLLIVDPKLHASQHLQSEFSIHFLFLFENLHDHNDVSLGLPI